MGLFTDPMGGAGKIVEADETYVGRRSDSKAFLPPAKKEACLRAGRAPTAASARSMSPTVHAQSAAQYHGAQRLT